MRLPNFHQKRKIMNNLTKISVLLISLSFSLQTFAHAGKWNRSACFLWLKKYVATSEVKRYEKRTVGSYVPCTPCQQWANGNCIDWSECWVEQDRWDFYSISKNDDQKCKKKTANAYSSGTNGSYYAWAHATNSKNGGTLNQFSNHWTLIAGNRLNLNLTKEENKKLEQANIQGFNYSNITTKIEIDSLTNELVIYSIEGTLNIEKGSDFFSTYQLNVLKDYLYNSYEDEQKYVEKVSNLEFETLQNNGSITLDKNGIQFNGILNNIGLEKYVFVQDGKFNNPLSDEQLNDLKNKGAVIDNNIQNIQTATISFNGEIRMPLNVNFDIEKYAFSVYEYVDGGYDFSILNKSQKTMSSTSIDEVEIVKDLYVYPVPASSTINIDLYLLEDIEVTLNLYDVLGKKVKELFNGSTIKGVNQIKDIDISNCTPGLYYIHSEYNNINQKTTPIIIK